jgi:hypothetical protein
MEKQLDFYIAKIESQKEKLKEDPSYAQYAYVTHDDLKNINWDQRRNPED